MLLNFKDRDIDINALKNITAHERKNLKSDRDIFNIMHDEKLQLLAEREVLLDNLLANAIRSKEITNEMVRLDSHINQTINMVLSRHWPPGRNGANKPQKDGDAPAQEPQDKTEKQ